MNSFQVVKTWRRSCDAIMLTLNLIIMSIVGRHHGFKVITLTFLLFASDSICIWFKQIVNIFCKVEPTSQHNKTFLRLHRWGSFKSQSQWVSCQILRLSQSWDSEQAKITLWTLLSLCTLQAYVIEQAQRGEQVLTLMSTAILCQILHVESLQQVVVDVG